MGPSAVQPEPRLASFLKATCVPFLLFLHPAVSPADDAASMAGATRSEIRFDDGGIAEEGYTVDGQRHGRWVYWYRGKEPRKRMEGDFDRGRMTGKWTFWSEDGRQKREMGVAEMEKLVPAAAGKIASAETAKWEGIESWTFSDADGRKYLLLRSPRTKKLVLCYSYMSRYLDLKLGSKRRLVLVVERSSKGGATAVADIDTGKSWRVDTAAYRQYERNAKPEAQAVWYLQGRELSPDDSRVLLRAACDLTSTEPVIWCYSVETRTGKVLREFQTENPPKEWWRK